MLGARIHRARRAAGLSLRALADRVGLSQTAIAKYEKGQLTPSSTTLLALAKACDVRVEYFLRPDHVELGAVEYRKRSRLPKKALARIQANVLDQAERFVEVLRIYPEPPIPRFAVPIGVPDPMTSLDQVEDAAIQVREAWQLGQNPLPDLTGTLEGQGVLVMLTQGDDNGRFDGLAAAVDGFPVVVVGADWPGDRQRFTLAHELGHLVLHDRLAEAIDEEKACNRFAGAFLAPRPAVIRELGASRRTLEPRELYALKHEYGLSMAGWIFRAKDTGILSEGAVTRLFKLFSARGWRRLEPGDQVPPERPHLFEQLVFHALAEDFIGEAKAAELLAERQAEFRTRRWLEDPAGAPPHQ